MLRCRYPGGALGSDELAVTRMLPVSAAWSRPAHHHLVHRQAADTGSILVTASSSPPRPPPGYRQRSILITSYSSSRLTHHQLSNPVSEEVNLFASSIEECPHPALHPAVLHGGRDGRAPISRQVLVGRLRHRRHQPGRQGQQEAHFDHPAGLKQQLV